jgi:hypothetical protein
MDTNRAPVITAYFAIIGENIDADEISSVLGVEATLSGRKGETLPGKSKPTRETFWEKSLEQRKHSIDDVVEAVFAEIWSHRNELLVYVESRDALIEVLCTVDLSVDGASYSLSRGTIAKLAFFHAGFDLDISDFR